MGHAVCVSAGSFECGRLRHSTTTPESLFELRDCATACAASTAESGAASEYAAAVECEWAEAGDG